MSKKEKLNSKIDKSIPKKRKKKIIRLSISLAIVAALVVCGIIFIPRLLNTNDDAGTTLQKRTAVVVQGDIVKTIGASGPLESSDKKAYRPEKASEIVEIQVEDGDYVVAGDTIMVLDSSSTDSAIQASEDQIEGKQGQIEDKQDMIVDRYDAIDDRREDISDKKDEIDEIESSIADLEDEAEDTEGLRADLYMYAPISGTVFDIMVSVGDTINTNSIFATVTDTLSYEVEMPFSVDFLTGEIQEVVVDYRNDKIPGEIISYADYTYKDRFGNELVDVVIAFSPDISLPANGMVTAIIRTDEKSYYCNTDTRPYFSDTEKITAEVPGEILELFLIEKQSVEEGNLVAVIDGASIDNTADNLSNQIESLNNQIDSLNDSIEIYYENIDTYYEDIADFNDDIESLLEDIVEIEADIDDAREEYEDAVVTADFNGIVTNIGVNEGDTVNTNVTLFTLVSMDNPEMQLAIDELDIAEIKEGLEAIVVIDALLDTEKTPVAAIVTAIALEGNSQGGVTTYDVTVTLTEPVEGLRLSMNATATIYTSRSDDTLYIPIEAVVMRNGISYVYVDDSIVSDTDVKANINTDTEKTADDGTAERTGGKGGGNFDLDSMTAEEITALKARLAEKGMTIEDVQGQPAPGTTGETVSSMEDYYAGAHLVEVTTGIYNETSIEILTGLTVGQKIVLPPIYTSAATTSAAPDASKLMTIPGTGGGRGSGIPPTGGK